MGKSSNLKLEFHHSKGPLKSLNYRPSSCHWFSDVFMVRSSPLEVLSGKGILKISCKFAGEQSCRRTTTPKYDFYKVPKHRNHISASVLQLHMKKKFWHKYLFPCEFWEICKITCFCKTPLVAVSEINFLAQMSNKDLYMHIHINCMPQYN